MGWTIKTGRTHIGRVTASAHTPYQSHHHHHHQHHYHHHRQSKKEKRENKQMQQEHVKIDAKKIL